MKINRKTAKSSQGTIITIFQKFAQKKISLFSLKAVGTNFTMTETTASLLLLIDIKKSKKIKGN